MVRKLQDAKIGDPNRLSAIRNALENGRIVYESDKKYLQEKFNEMQKNGSDINAVNNLQHEQNNEQKLQIIAKLQESEIGNNEKLETMRKCLVNNEILSKENEDYLIEKYDQLKKIDNSEIKIQEKLDIIHKLKINEIGNSIKLTDLQKRLTARKELSSEDESYLQTKFEQYKKIKGAESSITKTVPKSDPIPDTKTIKQKRPRPVDPDAKYCAYCQRSVHPERDFSVAALVVLLFLGILPGVIYYFLKAPTCPICKHNRWQIPPDDE